MIEILHTHDAAQAELVRTALQSAGIHVESLDDNFDPFLGNHVLAVSEADAPRAIAIRRKIEHAGTTTPTTPSPARKIVFAAFMIAIAVWAYLVWRTH